jgi:NDP-sugar pyrophosphorylase family protein
MHKNPKVENIDVVILCGGLGKRLRSMVTDRPKPMAEIHDHPFLDILMQYISGFGFRRFILCTGYMGNKIKNHYKNKKRNNDVQLIVSEEKEPLGTGGAIKNAEPFISSNIFLAMNGDSICKMDMLDFLDFHKTKQATASIALAAPETEKDYGVVTIDSNNRITSFSEKTRDTGFINAGVYLFNKDILKLIPDNKYHSLEYNLFPNILDAGIYGYVTGGEVLDIGTPGRYERAKNNDFLKRIIARSRQ